MVIYHNYRKWIGLFLIASTLLLIVIDMTVLYTVLPIITRELHLTASKKLWIINAYPLVVAGLLPITGMLSDRIGHKKMLMSGFPIFTLASIFAAFSPNSACLIASRILLAAGASIMMPATLSIVRYIFTEPKERSLAIGIWAAVASGGAAIGPLLGGILLEYFWWGSVFLINVPIITLLLPLSLFIIPNCGGNKKRYMDIFGSIFILISLISLIYALKQFSNPKFYFLDFSISIIIGILFMILFISQQNKQNQPIIDFSLFKNNFFSAGIITALITMSIVVSIELLLSQRLQLVIKLSPLQTALCIIPIPIASMIASPLIGLLLPKLQEKKIIIIGFLLKIIGITNVIIFYEFSLSYLIINLFIFGIGVGIIFTTASNTIMTHAPDEKSGMASSIEDIAYELGSVLGITILGGLMTLFYRHILFIPTQIIIDKKIFDSIDQALNIALTMHKNYAEIIILAANTAFNKSLILVFIAMIIILIISIFIIKHMLSNSNKN
uniref:MFS transporter n=1 Tax=Candidatus Aschnera chinzeii TaxID=1485666 RepID=A0AAT9G4H8_9ENTR|nr:MAG: MFS transporter [Candidatus Aschnera chinzeii]